MLNFGASKPRVGGGAGPPGPPLDPHLHTTAETFGDEFLSLDFGTFVACSSVVTNDSFT